MFLGVLVIDEMKLSSRISFDKSTLKINGFTDLGQYTPQHQRNLAGDHALVLLFQPFQGDWFQVLGSFLSHGAATGSILRALIVEATTMLEKANFQVECITTDGATWNRAMWSQFLDPGEFCCEHFFDSSRKLHFVSDFPHLIKNLRNWILKTKQFMVSISTSKP